MFVHLVLCARDPLVGFYFMATLLDTRRQTAQVVIVVSSAHLPLHQLGDNPLSLKGVECYHPLSVN